MTAASAYGPYDFLDDAELEPPHEYARQVRAFMLDVCDHLAERLPDVARSSLTVAQGFHCGNSTPAELEAARVACWEYLGPRSCEFQDPDVNVVRAVICLLFPDSNDHFQSVHNFLHFALGAGMPESQLLLSLQTHFRARTQSTLAT